MAVDVIGTEDTTRTSTTKTWSRRDGEQESKVIAGERSAAETTYEGFKGNTDTDTLVLRTEGGKGVVEVTLAQDDQTPALNDIWELLGREVLKDIRTHQDYNQSADQDEMDLARTAVLEGRGAIISTSGWSSESVDYLGLLLRGTSQYVRSQPILRRSVRTSDRGILDIAWDGVDRAWKLNNETGSPNPPADLVGDISAMPEADGSKKQWLKKAPQKRQVTRTLYEVVFEYHFARRWSNSLYAGDAETDNP